MAKHLFIERSLNFFIEFLLIFLIFFSPLIYGGITIEPLSLIEFISFVILFLFIFKLFLRDRISLVRVPALPLLLFLVLTIFQLMPLPRVVLSLLSPSALSLYAAFGANAALSYAPLSIYREATVNILMQYLSFLAVFFVVVNYVKTKKRAKRFIVSIIICGFLYSFYGIMRMGDYYGSNFSTFTNKDHFAAYIGMVIPITICAILGGGSKPKTLILIFMAIVELLALISCTSRGSYLSFAMSIAILVIALKARRSISNVLLVIILFSPIIYFLKFVDLGSIAQKFSTLSSPQRILSGRVDVLKDSFGIIKDFPLFGTGLGTFGQISHMYQARGPYRAYNFCHNEPMQILTEAGIFGFLFASIFFFRYAKNVFYAWRRNTDPAAVYMTLGLSTGVFSISLHSLFDFVFHVPANVILFSFILAAAYRASSIRDDDDSISSASFKYMPSGFTRKIFIITSCVILIFIELIVTRRYQAERLFKETVKMNISNTDANAVLGYKAALKNIETAVRLNPLNSSYISEEGELFLEMSGEGNIKNTAHTGKFNKKTEFLSSAEMSYKRAAYINPTNPDLHLRLGWLYGLLDRTDYTRAEFKKASLLDPRNIAVHMYLCRYFLSVNEKEDFFYHLTKAVQIYRLNPSDHIAGTNKFPSFLEEIGYEYLIK